MDKPRPNYARNRRIRRMFYVTVVVAIGGVATLGVSRLEPASPSVDGQTLYTDTVQRGEMLLEVRGLGRLVPEQVRWIPATTQGLVERILVQPGREVTPNTVVVELSNPELEQTTLDVDLRVRAAEAELANLRVQLRSNMLNQRASAASIEAEYIRAELQYQANSELSEEGLISDLDLNLSRVQAEQSRQRNELEQERLLIASEANEAQLAVQELRVDQLKALSALRQGQLGRLQVRAGILGVLQEVPIEVGQQLSPGDNIARVAEPDKLKAELQIAETQARDIQLGQYVAIDTRNGIIPGTVARIDPAVLNGTVTVDVRLDGALPRGARPDLSVDGTIEIQRLSDVLYVGRPSFGQANSLVGMFRLTEEGEAVRIPVRLGQTSVSTIQIVDGLAVGDTVILSDMSQWDAFDRIRIN